jgi:hypothetical protein
MGKWFLYIDFGDVLAVFNDRIILFTLDCL